jgi:hypothetical protein
MKKFLDIIKDKNYYKCYSIGDKPIIIYEGHRFIVPILWLAKMNNIINFPINFICFDRHTDTLDNPDKNREMINRMQNSKNFNDVFDFVDKELHENNDDWLKLLMNLNFIQDAVIIGGGATSNYRQELDYIDSGGNKHLIKNLSNLENAFEYQGTLSDISKNHQFKQIWDIIGWEYIQKKRFIMQNKPIFLDFDLDYFTFQWRGRNYAWQNNFYHYEFDHETKYFTTNGWSGAKFLNKLIKRTPFITIAKESKCCGGKDESSRILEKLNDKFFKNVIFK